MNKFSRNLKNKIPKKKIFLRMPRCGSTSLVKTLEIYGFDIFGGTMMGFWTSPSTIVKPNTSNSLSKCVSNYIGETNFEKSFKVSSVRNPFTRAFSIWKHWSWQSVKFFDDFIKCLEQKDYPNLAAKWHSSTLSENLICKKNLMVDRIIKLESIQNDYDNICDALKIQREIVPYLNKSKSNKDYLPFFSDSIIEKINEIYYYDFVNFDYSFEFQSTLFL